MEVLLDIGVTLLRLVPLILAFYIPALLGVAILKERGESYKLRAGLWFALGFGLIIGVQLLFQSGSTLETLQTMLVSLVQLTAALLLAAFTVYRLAD